MGGTSHKKGRHEEIIAAGPSEMITEQEIDLSDTTLTSCSDEEEILTVEEKSDCSQRKNYDTFEENRKRKYVKTRKTPKVKTPEGIKLTNQFESLSGNDEDEPIEPDPSPKNFPPIVVKTGMSPKSFVSEVLKFVKNDSKISFKHRRGTISIYTTSSEDYTIVQEKLKEKKYEFHSFSPKQDRVKRLVIKGLNCDYTPQEVKEELTQMGLEITKVTNMYKGKHMLNMFIVCFPTTTQLNTVLKSYKFKYVCMQKVSWCKYAPNKSVVQCYRCQRFGHSSINCNYVQRCVKCINHHGSEKCPKEVTQEVKCINCGGAHPANYRQCTNYLDYVSKIKKYSNKSKRPNQIIDKPVTVFRTTDTSYSNITKNVTKIPVQTQTKNTEPSQANVEIRPQRVPTITIPNTRQTTSPTQPEDNAQILEDEINRLFACSFQELAEKIDQFVPKLQAEKSDIAKRMMLIKFVAQFK